MEIQRIYLLYQTRILRPTGHVVRAGEEIKYGGVDRMLLERERVEDRSVE
jgi:hypothetical protein